MTDVAKRFVGPTAVAATATTVYTSAAPTCDIVRNIHVVNTTAAAIAFTCSIGADIAGTRLASALPIPANGFLDIPTFLVVMPAEIIQAYGGSTGLTLTISGVEN